MSDFNQEIQYGSYTSKGDPSRGTRVLASESRQKLLDAAREWGVDTKNKTKNQIKSEIAKEQQADNELEKFITKSLDKRGIVAREASSPVSSVVFSTVSTQTNPIASPSKPARPADSLGEWYSLTLCDGTTLEVLARNVEAGS